MFNSVDYVRGVCERHGIPVSKLEKDCGFSNGYLNPKKLKKIPYDRAIVIAKYLSEFESVTAEYIMTGNKKAPTTEGGRDDDERLKAAFFEGADPSLTKEEIDDLWQDAKEYMFIKIKQRKMKRD